MSTIFLGLIDHCLLDYSPFSANLISLILVINLIFLDIEIYKCISYQNWWNITRPPIKNLCSWWRQVLKLILINRADEWNVNKWAWEGALKVVSKEEECIIKLEDKTTGVVSYSCYLKRIDIILGIIGLLFLLSTWNFWSRWALCSCISEKWWATSGGNCDWQQQVWFHLLLPLRSIRINSILDGL